MIFTGYNSNDYIDNIVSGKLYSNDYAFAVLQLLVVSGLYSDNYYGQNQEYYDFDTSSVIPVSTELSSGVESIVSNKYAFVALKDDGGGNNTFQAIPWGYSNGSENYGGSPYQGIDPSKSILSKLLSGVKEVVANEKSFLAIKATEIVVWGDAEGGGLPRIDDNSSGILLGTDVSTARKYWF